MRKKKLMSVVITGNLAQIYVDLKNEQADYEEMGQDFLKVSATYRDAAKLAENRQMYAEDSSLLFNALVNDLEFDESCRKLILRKLKEDIPFTSSELIKSVTTSADADEIIENIGQKNNRTIVETVVLVFLLSEELAERLNVETITELETVGDIYANEIERDCAEEPDEE